MKPFTHLKSLKTSLQNASTMMRGVCVARPLGEQTMISKGVAVFVRSFVLFSLALSLSAPFAPASAAITPLINYQGKLLTSSSVPVASGTYQIEFTLYDALTGGNVLWTASGTTGSPDPISVPVQSNGLFSILLGDTDNGQNTLEGVNWNTSSLYLGITVGSDSEMTPRKRLSSTPQAFNAEAWNGYKTATSINEGQGGEVLKLSQTSNDAASVLRTVLQLTTSGTSALLDSFLRLTDDTLGDVFTINRQGHTTTTGNLASLGNTFLGDADSDTLTISSRIASDLIPTLSNTFSLGSDSLRWNAFLGTASTTYLSANTLNVTSTLTYLNAEGTNTTTTHLSVTTLASLPENTTINGQSPCLADGTGCDTPTLQEVTNAGSFTTTSLTLFGGLTTSDLTATGTTSLQDFTFSHGTGTSLTLNGLFTVSSGLSSLQALTFTNATGSALNLTGAFTFANATGTSLFLSTLLSAQDILSTNSITINGTNVCLEDGTNCEVAPVATNFWTYDATDDFLRPNTSTTDLVLGAGSIATSPFYFQATPTSSRLYLGAFNSTGTNVVLGATTSTITNTAFQLDGNDLFVAGNIGSASSVYTNGAFIAGSGTTIFGDGFITRTGGNLTVSSSQHVLINPSSNVGIGTSTPGEKLTVVGGVQNILQVGQGGFAEVAEVSVGSVPVGVAVQGRYVYTANLSSNSLSIVDVSNPAASVEVAEVSGISGAIGVAVAGRYAYVATNAATLTVVDVSNPAAPVEVADVSTGSGSRGVAVQGRYAYVGNLFADSLSVMDISNPAAPVEVAELVMGDGAFGVAVQGRYVYVANNVANTLSVIDVSNPAAPVEAAEVGAGAGARFVAIQGRYAYVANVGANSLSIMDVSNPASPVEVAELNVGTDASGVAVQGRYAYVTNETADTLAVIDVSIPASPVKIAEVSAGDGAIGVAVQGRYAYVTNQSAASLSVIRIPGTETTALEAHSAEVGGLGVRGSAVINNGLTVGGGLNVGQGGIFSAGPLAVSATNTTSTFLGGFTAERAEFSQFLRVGNQLACLANGTNCQPISGAASPFVYNAAGDFLRPNTSTTDFVLGAGSIATSPFYFQTQTTSSRLYLGAFNATGTNVVLGATTSTITNTLFQLDGNDLFVAGNIGSASSVYTNGAFIAGDTLYGNGFINNPSGNLTVSSSAHVLFLPSSNVGIGTSTPSEKLTVVGGVQNILQVGQGGFVETDEVVTGSDPQSVAIQGRYVYVTNGGAGTLSVVDVSDPSNAVEVDEVATGSAPQGVAIQGRYAYVVNVSAGTLSIVDVSDPSNAVEVDEVATGSSPVGVAIQGRYAYVANGGAGTLSVVDVSDPSNAVEVDEVATGSAPQGVAIQGRYAYVANFTAGTLSIVDVSDPSNAVEVDEVATGAGPFAVAIQGRYAYVANFTAGTLSIVDVSDPSNAVEVDEVATGSAPQGVAIQGRYAYVANNGAGTLSIVDVSDPSNAVEVDEVATGSDSRGVAIQGRYAYVANSGPDTLSIVRIPGMETTALEAHSAEVGSIGVLTNAVVAGALTMGGGLGVGGQTNFNDEVGIYGSATSTRGTLWVSSECGGLSSANRIAAFAVRSDIKVSFRCNGQIFADSGTLGSGGDYAEYFISSDLSLEAGDVVAFDPQYATTVTKGMAALRPHTLGVVSVKPVVTGMGLLEHHPSSTLVGLLGQLDTNVSTLLEDNGGNAQGIQIGDPVMAGDNGIALKAKGPGMVLGRALEHFPAHATGTLRLFVNPHYWAGDTFATGASGEALLVAPLSVSSFQHFTASSTTLLPSPLFSLQGRVLGAATSTSYTHTYSFQTELASATTSQFTLFGEVLGISDTSTSSTKKRLLTLSQEGDLFLSNKLYPGEKMMHQDNTTLWQQQTKAHISFNGMLQSIHTNTGFSSDQDGFATQFKTKDILEPGDLVIFDPENPGYVKKSETYGTGAIAGVVAEYAGFVSGVETGDVEDTVVIVIVTGRSMVFVSTQNGEILSGDPLTSSDIPGVAMKATEPGAFLGIALEGWGEAGVGEVGVFVKEGGWFAGDALFDATMLDTAAGNAERGFAFIAAGASNVHVSYPSLNAYPMIFAAPSTDAGDWWIANQSDVGFDIILAAPLGHEVTFSWTAEPTPDGAVMWHSEGVSSPVNMMTGEYTLPEPVPPAP